MNSPGNGERADRSGTATAQTNQGTNPSADCLIDTFDATTVQALAQLSPLRLLALGEAARAQFAATSATTVAATVARLSSDASSFSIFAQPSSSTRNNHSESSTISLPSNNQGPPLPTFAQPKTAAAAAASTSLDDEFSPSFRAILLKLKPTRAELSAEANMQSRPLRSTFPAKDMEAIANGTNHASRTLFARPNKLVLDDSSTLSPLSRSQRTRNDRHGTAPMAAFTTTTTTTATTAASSVATLPLVDSSVPMETEAATQATQNGHDDGHRLHDRIGATAATATNGNRDPLTSSLTATRIGGGGGSSNNSGSDRINTFIPIQQRDVDTDSISDGRRTRTTAMIDTTTTNTANGSSAATFGTGSGTTFSFANNGSTTGLEAPRQAPRDLAQLGRAVATSPLADWTSVGEPRLVRSPFDDSLLEDRTKLLYSPIPMMMSGCTGRRRRSVKSNGMPPDCHTSGFVKTEVGPDGAVLSSATIKKEEFGDLYDQTAWPVKKEENAAGKLEQGATEERIARGESRIAAAKKRADDDPSALQQAVEQDCNGGGAMDVEEPFRGNNNNDEDGADESSTKPPAASVLVMSLGARVRARQASSTDMETTTVGSTGKATAAAVAAPKDATMENMECRAASSSSSSGSMDARREDDVATNKRARADDDDAPDDSAIPTRKSSRFGKEQMVAFDGDRKKAQSQNVGACNSHSVTMSGTSSGAMSTHSSSIPMTVARAAAAATESTDTIANQLMIATTSAVQQSSDGEATFKQKSTASPRLLSSSVDSYSIEEEAALATISNGDIHSPASYKVYNQGDFMDVESNGQGNDNGGNSGDTGDGTGRDVHVSSIAPAQCPNTTTNLAVREAVSAENAAPLSSGAPILADGSPPPSNNTAVAASAASIGVTTGANAAITEESHKKAAAVFAASATTALLPTETTNDSITNKAKGNALSRHSWTWTADTATSIQGRQVGAGAGGGAANDWDASIRGSGMSVATTSTTVASSIAGAAASGGVVKHCNVSARHGHGMFPSAASTASTNVASSNVAAASTAATSHTLSNPADKPQHVMPLAEKVLLTNGNAAATPVPVVQNVSTEGSKGGLASNSTGLSGNGHDEIGDQLFAGNSSESSVADQDTPDEEASVENGETSVEDDEPSDDESGDGRAVSETVTVYRLGGQWKLKVVVLDLGFKFLTQRSLIPPPQHRHELASLLETFNAFHVFLTYLADGGPAELPADFLGGGWEMYNVLESVHENVQRKPKTPKYLLFSPSQSGNPLIWGLEALENHVKACLVDAGRGAGPAQWLTSVDDDADESLEFANADSEAALFKNVTTYTFKFTRGGDKWKFNVVARQSGAIQSYCFFPPATHQLQFRLQTQSDLLYYLAALKGKGEEMDGRVKSFPSDLIDGWTLGKVKEKKEFTMQPPDYKKIRAPSDFHRYLEVLKTKANK